MDTCRCRSPDANQILGLAGERAQTAALESVLAQTVEKEVDATILLQVLHF